MLGCVSVALRLRAGYPRSSHHYAANTEKQNFVSQSQDVTSAGSQPYPIHHLAKGSLDRADRLLPPPPPPLPPPPKLPRSVALGVSVARNRQPHLWKRCTAWEDITEKGRGSKSSPAPAISPSHTAPGWRHPQLICPLIAIELHNKDETMFGTFYIQPYPILPS